MQAPASRMDLLPSVMQAPHFATANLTTAKAITSGSTFAVYVGKAPRAITTASLRFRVTTAAATITWAEVALATGSIVVGSGPSLTVVAWADVAGAVSSLSQKTVALSVASGQQIAEGADLWVLIGNAATTPMQVRAQSVADDLQVGVQAFIVGRPSLAVGVPQAYAIEGATIVAAWVAVVI